MTERARIKIAALTTAMFLAGMSVAGVIAHASKPATVARISNHPAPMGQAGRAGQSPVPQAGPEQDQHE